MDNEPQYIERELTQTEIRQRQRDHLTVLAEIDTYREEVEEHRRCVKEANTEIARLQCREQQLRRELRTGKVLEPRQVALSFESPQLSDRDGNPVEDPRERSGLSTFCTSEFDASTDEPAPEIDPPGPSKFDALYPLARTHAALRASLWEALTEEQYAKLPDGTIEQWHPDTGIFHAIASWARIEKAHADVPHRPPIAGLTVPRRLDMPSELVDLLGGKPPKKRRTRAPRETTT